METVTSFSFRARYYRDEEEPESFNMGSRSGPIGANPWINSSGRWESHEQAVNSACLWLKKKAEQGTTQYAIEIVQVEELELT